jgi:hypothetical protein
MIIDTMLGRWGTDYGYWNWGDSVSSLLTTIGNGINYARNNFNAWASLVRAYDAAGLVNWDVFAIFASGHLNSTGMNYGTDDEFFLNTDTIFTKSIQFKNSSGTVLYTINRSCGNIEGAVQALPPPPPYNLSAGPFCLGTTSKETLSWSGPAGIGVGPSGANGFWVDISTTSNFSSWYHKFVSASPTTAPDGFTSNPTDSPSMPPLVAGATYYYRVWNGTFSPQPWPSFVASNCAQPTLSCTGAQVTTNPSNPEANSTITTLTVNFFNNGSGSLMGATLSITAFGTTYSGVSFSPNPLSPNTSATGSISNIVAPATGGNYTITWIISGGNSNPNPTTCSGSIIIASKPYLRVYGGDVVAGADGLGTACGGTPPTSIITTYNNDSAGGYGGAGTQFGAQATGAINYFTSAMLRSSLPAPPNGLTFANTTPPSGGNYGGTFGSSPCIKDYYATAAAKGITPPIGPYTLPNSYNGIANGSHIVVYVNGDAIISNPITYGSWTTLAQIPSFYLIVKGNIYIDKGVTSLDGVYVAQDDGTGKGKIYTCASGTTPIAANKLADTPANGGCNSQLTINGAFIAQQVKFLRTFGTLSNAQASETPTSASRSCNGGTAAVCAGEVFVYGPELWLTNPGISSSSSIGSWQSVTSLPPVL